MARGRPKAPLSRSDDERRVLEGYTRQREIAQQLALRARIVLGCAAGAENEAVGEKLGVHPVTVGEWRARFLRDRLRGLSDAPRSGAPRSMSDEQVERVVKLTLEATPRNATLSLQPHRVESFRLSNDPT